ncbi:MAG: response regulator [Candidatus Thorarchaeota archaeon]|nr:response regulator [Candidatus Thorarchaeota archaeon]
MTIRIFIVDDELAIAEIMESYLRRFIDDFEVIHAKNGYEAIVMAEKMAKDGCIPHITLMDLKMPVMDGITCTERLAELGINNVHILSAYVNPGLISEALQAGAKGLMQKSEGLGTVAMKVAEMLRSMPRSALNPS